MGIHNILNVRGIPNILGGAIYPRIFCMGIQYFGGHKISCDIGVKVTHAQTLLLGNSAIINLTMLELKLARNLKLTVGRLYRSFIALHEVYLLFTHIYS